MVNAALYTLCKEMARLARLREHNAECVGQMHSQYGAVRAQKIADELGHESALARDLFEPLSGTELGKLILCYGSECISLYPHTLTTPPQAA